MKYFVRLVRPVFQEALVEVEAGSDAEAAELALDLAEGLADRDWRGFFDPSAYSHHIARVASKDDLDGDSPEQAVALDVSDKCYMLLEADTDSGEGAVLPQPWMQNVSSLMATDLTSDWIGELGDLKADGLRSFLKELEEHQLPPGVASFAKYLWRKRMVRIEDEG